MQCPDSITWYANDVQQLPEWMHVACRLYPWRLPHVAALQYYALVDSVRNLKKTLLSCMQREAR